MLVSKTLPKSTKKPSKNDVEKRLEKNSLQDPQKKKLSWQVNGKRDLFQDVLSQCEKKNNAREGMGKRVKERKGERTAGKLLRVKCLRLRADKVSESRDGEEHKKKPSNLKEKLFLFRAGDFFLHRTDFDTAQLTDTGQNLQPT